MAVRRFQEHFAVLYDNTVVPLDYNDKPFISGAIYYAEENKDVKLATVSSGANVVRNKSTRRYPHG